MFVIKNEKDHYVARYGRVSSYTAKLQHAQLFDTREAADAAKCDNERVVSIEADIYAEGTR